MTEAEFLAAHGGPAGAQQSPEIGMTADDFLAAHGGPAEQMAQEELPTDSFTQAVAANGGDIWAAQAAVNDERQQRMDAEHQAWIDDNANWGPTDWIKYHEELPIPISADVAASPELEARLIRANELATGTPYLGEGGRTQEEVDADRQEMQATGSTNPLDYIQRQEAVADPVQNLAARTVQAAGEGLYEGTKSTIQGLLGQSNAIRTGQAEAGYQEAVEQVKDEDSLIGPYMAETVRGAAGSVGRVAPGLTLAAITRDPRIAYAVMGGQTGVDAYAQKESEGWSPMAAALYGAAAGGVEVATEVAGGKVAGGLGLTTAEEAFKGAAKKSIFSGVKNAKLRKAFEATAGTLMEGGEEVAAARLNYVKDVMAGIPPDQIRTEDDLKAFLGGVLAGGAMNTAAAAVDALTAPDRPVDASQQDVAPESPEAVGTPPEATQEAGPSEQAYKMVPPGTYYNANGTKMAIGPGPISKAIGKFTGAEQQYEIPADFYPTQEEAIRARDGIIDAPYSVREDTGEEPDATEPVPAEPPAPRKIRSSDKVNLESIPEDLSIEVDAVRAKTGEKIKVTKPAREIVSRLSEDITSYKKLIACLGR